MSKKVKAKDLKNRSADSIKKPTTETPSILPWMILLAAITAICFSPMLRNGFTNWDDPFYVLNNNLLHGPDWKGIFTQPVVSNYHPLTILSLAFNYYLSGLNPFSYQIVNLLLHVTNTLLVFYFIWLISDKKIWVALLTACIFGIHPMHVESVAWISERKDVLYTPFFLLSLTCYWQYIKKNRYTFYWISFSLFVLSLLSKPAAVILPLVFLLLDYWTGRKYIIRIWVEKIPFLLCSLIMGIVTLNIQSHKAIAGLAAAPLWSRMLSACYGLMLYAIRFIFPFPLSTFHPYPDLQSMLVPLMMGPVFLITLIAVLWWFRKNKLVVFSLLFFIINLLLVLQVVTVGNTIVSERYTYVPYIGLAFLFSTWWNDKVMQGRKMYGWIALAAITLIFGALTFERTTVWENSDTLWSDVIKHYPNAPIPHGNRAIYYYDLASEPGHASEKNFLYQKVIEDCTVAIAADSNYQKAYEYRGAVYIEMQKYNEALNDGEKIIRLAPDEKAGYFICGKAYSNLDQPQKAVDDYSKCLVIKPDDNIVLYSRGVIYYNKLKQYPEALADFNKAIQLDPNDATYYESRSFCYYSLGNIEEATTNARKAMQLGRVLPEKYKAALNL